MIGADYASLDEEKGQPDLTKAKVDGNLSFCIVRGMEGTTPDEDYHANVMACSGQSLPCSPYLLLKFGGDSAPEQQVDDFTTFIGPQTGRSLIPCIDVEIPGGRSTTGLTAAEALAWLQRAWAALKTWCGAPPLIYTSAEFWADPDGMNGLPAPWIADSGLWVKYWPYPVDSTAQYDPKVIASLGNPAIPTPWGSQFVIQQYQGDAINYPGFPSTVDLNRCLLVSYGAQGDTVKWIQKRVGVTPDGIFGPQTKTAVMTFQTAHGLKADGIVGYDTKSVLSWHNPV